VILVIGGRSKIGWALIDDLVARGEAVRALIRASERSAAFPAGVQTVTGDLADQNSLRMAMRRVEKLFLLCGPSSNEVELNRNAIDAAKEAGVGLLVRSSILGSDLGSPAIFVRDHGACDRYLQESGVPHTVIRPNLFLQNVPESTIPGIDGEGNFYVNAGDARISMIDTRDVAAVAAVALTEPGHEGNSYDVTGPEALSYRDVAAKLSAVAGRTISYVEVPDQAVHDALVGFGLSEWFAGALVDLYQEYKRSGADGYASRVSDIVPELTGRAPRTLDSILMETRDALGA
jgi:uncharacterized protein YbjT (DUF2867 family)